MVFEILHIYLKAKKKSNFRSNYFIDLTKTLESSTFKLAKQSLQIIYEYLKEVQGNSEGRNKQEKRKVLEPT